MVFCSDCCCGEKDCYDKLVTTKYANDGKRYLSMWDWDGGFPMANYNVVIVNDNNEVIGISPQMLALLHEYPDQFVIWDNPDESLGFPPPPNAPGGLQYYRDHYDVKCVEIKPLKKLPDTAEAYSDVWDKQGGYDDFGNIWTFKATYDGAGKLDSYDIWAINYCFAVIPNYEICVVPSCAVPYVHY